jgi:hypothetical protein
MAELISAEGQAAGAAEGAFISRKAYLTGRRASMVKRSFGWV